MVVKSTMTKPTFNLTVTVRDIFNVFAAKLVTGNRITEANNFKGIFEFTSDILVLAGIHSDREDGLSCTDAVFVDRTIPYSISCPTILPVYVLTMR